MTTTRLQKVTNRPTVIDEARESETEDGATSVTGSNVTGRSHQSHLSGPYFPADVATPTQNQEVVALRSALQECWTLCNTLANLSYIHRRRLFKSSWTPDAHERAWKACWRMCQELHESRRTDNNDEDLRLRTSLNMCRDFCQALFDVRQRRDEAADSVLRVSFELNNQYVVDGFIIYFFCLPQTHLLTCLALPCLPACLPACLPV